jgi:hypothetical protein
MYCIVGFEVFTAVVLKSIFFWDMTPRLPVSSVILLIVNFAYFLADVYRLEQGLEPQHYDAFLLFSDEDQDFAMQIMDRMETEYGLKVWKHWRHSKNRIVCSVGHLLLVYT